MDHNDSDLDSKKAQELKNVPDNCEPTPIGSIPIRLPKNAVGNFSESSKFQQATTALSETPQEMSSSLGKGSPGVWSIEPKSSSVDSNIIGLPGIDSVISNGNSKSPKLGSSLTTGLLNSSSLAQTAPKKPKGKFNVTFKTTSSNFDSQSDFAGSYEINKHETARLLKRHLVTTDSSINNSNQFPEMPIDISSSPTYGSLSKSDRRKNSNVVAADSYDDSSCADNYRPKIKSSKKYKRRASGNSFPKDSEADEYDSLLSSNDSGDENVASASGERHKKVKTLVNPLTLQSGDITHSLYKWQRDNSKKDNYSNIKRNKSYSVVKDLSNSNGHEFNLPFTSQDINQPGGFRRYYVRQRAINEGRDLPEGMTSSFVDFISLYGHFAGGNYPSDEDETDSELDFDSDEERSEYYSQLNRVMSARAGGSGYGSIPRERSTTQLRPESKASSKKAFFLLIKAFVGTGVLFLPKSFHNGGLLFSIVLMAVIAYLALHCMLLLVECHSKLKMSYGDIGYHLMGEKVRKIVLASIVISQIGFCCAYSIFVATNTKFLFNTFTDCKMNFPLSFWILIQFIIYIPMSMVRKIKNFSILALIADVFIVIGIGYLFYYDGHVLAKNGISDIVMFNPVTFPMLVGTAVFSFEGIGLVIPVVDSMKKPSEFPKVLSLTVFVSAVIFISVASFSYMAFGENVETVILLNLTEGGNATTFIQFLYSIAIIFSVPLQLFPAIRILEENLFTKSGKRNNMVKWQKNVFRLGLCLLVAATSIFVSEQLDEFVSIIGSFACVPLSFIYPSIFHYYAIDTNSKATKIKDICLFIFGIFTMIYVTNLTLTHWGKGTPPVDQCPNANYTFKF
ncbi:Vacuolar amino acid transporter 3 [Smittium culicis]|uniref:Vacuolar amino acid transporter 3 n=1 Tax=Smittium culicis TaxID=133412 RepID=A0A1R1YQU7_9FUNG|nr:Vacuolar amino acid transporter 3 [Smittium culicis]